MRIAVIGGLDRHGPEISQRAAAAGHSVEFHHGHVGGRHAGELESIVQRCDLAIVVTSVNSHGAMYIAKKAASRFGRALLIVRTCGPSRFSTILDECVAAANGLARAAGA